MNNRLTELMQRAFELSRLCPPSSAAFAVGAIACSAGLQVLAEAYSRETGPADHAEEVLLAKLARQAKRAHTLVCTLEPCLLRASKPLGCAHLVTGYGFSKVVYAIDEDRTFVRQSGIAHLRDHGLQVARLPGYTALFRDLNATIYATSKETE